LSCYGYGRNTSPNIDNLARGGILFAQVIAQGPETIPSVPAVITSHYFEIGDWFNTMDKIKDVKFSAPTIQEILKSKGYFAIYICGSSVLSGIKGMRQGWNKMLTFTGSGKPDAKMITDKAIEWIRRVYYKPFSLNLHYMDVHRPYTPPSNYKNIFIGDKLNFPVRHIPIVENFCGEGGIPKALVENGVTDLNYYIAQYDAAIKFVDDQIGLLLAELKKLALENNTLVIITADHGEAFGEHNFFLAHVCGLYDEFIKVPLIMKLPNGMPASKVINHQVQLIDIAPTILEILGIDNNYNMKGLSLLPLITKGEGYNREYVFSAGDGISCVRTSRMKLIRYAKGNNDERYSFFNLEDDPSESVNLIDSEGEQFKHLKQELDIWLKDASKDFIVKGYSTGETKNKLKSLGYIQ